jgi:carbon monoxide dehydrogenase subunit G
MNLQYTFQLPVPLESVWRALLDVRRVAPCLPGAAIESGEGDDFLGRMKVKLGPIEMTYRGTVRLTQRDDVNHTALLTAAAKEIKGGGGATATINLRAAPAGTGSEVTVQSDFNVSGKAAQFGRGVMEEIGAKLMGEFAVRLAALLASEAPAAATAPAPVPDEIQALDVIGLAWGPTMRRLLVPAILGVVALLATGVYFALRSG